MKKFFTCIIMVAAGCIIAMAQPQTPQQIQQQWQQQRQHLQSSQEHGMHNWGARMKSEKIGFLTSEMGLTPEEAQVFWPIYNKAEQEKMAAMTETFKAYGAVQEGIKSNSQDLQKLLNAYLEANGKINEIEKKYVGEYTKVIPAEKVAKLYVAEERFRREQINRLKGPWGMGDRPQDKVSQ